ncbi:hypothetical protein PAECIP112173_00343 [Paenibacillus sp. JJ-100]|uniref:hypothetical protein n=1 Tax=Paenibacillus sp. JJ-100 TaxID=2974896 RepID=UPI0022FF9D2B|nr:hypothetical protein [Paenibacillus sp. JJ-100]CAI6023418.1 hypothetical protein PAECIP112173_00343 [Paenibacillus sp. JJ-100]
MKYPVTRTFRDKSNYIRYDQGSVYETEDLERAEHLQKLEFIGPELKEKTKTRGKTAVKGKSVEPGGDADEPGKVKSKDTPAKEE